MTTRLHRFKPAPRSTYRVQLTPTFGFREAREIVPYLSRLGISDLYCSPFLTARPGSTHGYDVVDPLHLNPELGGEDAFYELSQALHEHHMGLLLDIVPNHMAASSENPWWLDVLENGPSSPYSDFFDIEWDPALPGGLENRVLLPILGSPYGETLENGELQIESDQIGFHLKFYESALPLSTISYLTILEAAAANIERRLGSENRDWQSYARLMDEIESTPHRAAEDTALIERRRVIRRLLESELPRLRQVPVIGAELDAAVKQINGTPGDPRSFDLLDRVVSSQAYRLAFWQLAREQINYRRFFDINDLISMRVEEERVFSATHQRILVLVADGHVSGLRIDHLDGLWDPQAYLDRLQRAVKPGSESDGGRFVIVEKILAEEEKIPPEWPVAGTTGYEFMNVLNGLFVDREGLGTLERTYRDVTGTTDSFHELVYRAKLRVLEESFAANVQSLSALLGRIADIDRHGRDLTFESLRAAVVEVTTTLPVYRTYVNSFEVDEADRAWIETAIGEAIGRRPELRHALAFVRRVLLLEIPPDLAADDRGDWLLFVMRWQQMTGPAMAKGDEDTALYQYNRLVSLNEVGGRPDTEGVSIDEWHKYAQRTQIMWPQTLNATSTHDTKRSEDVRARIAVLSEIPDEWDAAVSRWREFNADARSVRNGVPVPDPNVEWLIYQSLVGVWPNSDSNCAQLVDRLKGYVTKALREAKIHTSWTSVDSVYESAVLGFVEAILDKSAATSFLDDFAAFHQRIAPAGAMNSLSQLVLKLTAPGVPDVYQGTELWDYSLVDPDNRRPVNYELRQNYLQELSDSPLDGAELTRNLSHNWTDGRIKLWVLHRTLQLRNTHSTLFSDGTYAQVAVFGPARQRVIAFAREHGEQQALILAPRLVARLLDVNRGLSLSGVWDETLVSLPRSYSGQWTNVFSKAQVQIGIDGSGADLAVGDVLGQFPVGLLIRG
ncbi:MAG: malto-oligosyltrehalose synthase [Nitrolancea sp.]